MNATVTVETTKPRAPDMIELIEAKTPGHSNLSMCIQCGTCGGSCPSGADMEHTPRQIFSLLRAGLLDEVLSSKTPWYCVSCYLCTVRCPQEVRITDIMYTLKNMAIKKGLVSEKAASDLSETFIEAVDKYGRSFELGLASRQFLKYRHMSVTGMASMGLGMISKGRMELTPEKIDGIFQLRSILMRAKELEAENE